MQTLTTYRQLTVKEAVKMPKKSTASILAAKKDKSMFPVFVVKNPMPVKKSGIKTKKITISSGKLAMKRA